MTCRGYEPWKPKSNPELGIRPGPARRAGCEDPDTLHASGPDAAARCGGGSGRVRRGIQNSWRATALRYGSQGQHEGVVATARTICDEFASPGVAHSLYFGCEPDQRAAREATVDFRKLVSRRGDGRLVLFQPARDGVVSGCPSARAAPRSPRSWWMSSSSGCARPSMHRGCSPPIPQRRVTACDRWRADPADLARPASPEPTAPAAFAAGTATHRR